MQSQDATSFLHSISRLETTNPERAVALLWFCSLQDHEQALSPSTVAKMLQEGGFGQQNASRLRNALERDKRTAKNRTGTFRIRIDARKELDDRYSELLLNKPILGSNSVLPKELTLGTRDYIERVAAQLNASYDNSLYDCCAVMSRRLLETLIIEVYEKHSRAHELKGADSNFMMFSGLLSVFESDRAFNPSRNAVQGLHAFKKLGDLSAHNRRFNARRDDIDRIRDGMRVAVEELLHIASLSKA
jgi:hypothetical protein